MAGEVCSCMVGKQVAFKVTPSWWHLAPVHTRHLVLTTALQTLPLRFGTKANVFSIAQNVFVYDIAVGEDVSRAELESIRRRVLAEFDSIYSLLPSGWGSESQSDLGAWTPSSGSIAV